MRHAKTLGVNNLQFATKFLLVQLLHCRPWRCATVKYKCVENDNGAAGIPRLWSENLDR